MLTRLLPLLVACLPGLAPAAEPPVDPHGDPLPEGAVARLGAARWSPGAQVEYLAFTPDGKELVTVDSASRVCRWDAATGKVRGEFRADTGDWRPDHYGPHILAALAPDGRTIAVSNRQGVRLWALASGREVRSLARSPRDFGFFSLCFLGGGKYVAATNPQTVVCWDLDAREVVCDFKPEWAGPIVAVGGLSDGKTLQLVSQGQDGGVLRTYERDGEWKLARTVQLGPWDGDSWKPWGLDPWNLPVSPDRRWLLLVQRPDARASLVDTVTGKVVALTDSLPHGQYAFSPDGKKLVGRQGADTLVSWDLATGKVVSFAGPHPARTASSIRWSNETPRLMAVSADGRWLAEASSRPHRLRLWDLKTNEARPAPGASELDPAQMAVSADSSTARVLSADRMSTWDLATGREVGKPRKTYDARLTLSPCGRFVLRRTGFLEEQSWLYRLDPPQAVDTFPDDVDLINAAFSPNGRYFGAWERGKARVSLFESATGKRLAAVDLPEEKRGLLVTHIPHIMAVSGDGRWLFVHSAEGGYFGDARSGKRHSQAGEDYPSCFRWAAFSNDGQTLALGQNIKRVVLIETVTGRQRGVLEPAAPRETPGWSVAGPEALAWSPDAGLLAVGLESGPVEWWDVYAGKRLGQSVGHRGPVKVLQFTPDGKHLVSGSEDVTALVWETGPWRARLTPAPLTDERRRECWERLSGANSEAAWAAVGALARDPGAVAFLGERVTPAAGPDRARLGRLLQELDSDDFATRQRARERLEKEGRSVVPFLEAALKDKPSAEVRRQLEGLLPGLRDAALTAEELRQVRAVEVLEAHRATEALKRLAGGDRGAFLTRQAREALDRLNGR